MNLSSSYEDLWSQPLEQEVLQKNTKTTASCVSSSTCQQSTPQEIPPSLSKTQWSDCKRTSISYKCSNTASLSLNTVLLWCCVSVPWEVDPLSLGAADMWPDLWYPTLTGCDLEVPIGETGSLVAAYYSWSFLQSQIMLNVFSHVC